MGDECDLYFPDSDPALGPCVVFDEERVNPSDFNSTEDYERVFDTSRLVREPYRLQGVLPTGREPTDKERERCRAADDDAETKMDEMKCQLRRFIATLTEDGHATETERQLKTKESWNRFFDNWRTNSEDVAASELLDYEGLPCLYRRNEKAGELNGDIEIPVEPMSSPQRLVYAHRPLAVAAREMRDFKATVEHARVLSSYSVEHIPVNDLVLVETVTDDGVLKYDLACVPSGYQGNDLDDEVAVEWYLPGKNNAGFNGLMSQAILKPGKTEDGKKVKKNTPWGQTVTRKDIKVIGLQFTEKGKMTKHESSGELVKTKKSKGTLDKTSKKKIAYANLGFKMEVLCLLACFL